MGKLHDGEVQTLNGWRDWTPLDEDLLFFPARGAVRVDAFVPGLKALLTRGGKRSGPGRQIAPHSDFSTRAGGSVAPRDGPN